MNSKKGLSTVVITVILILVGILAVMLLWSVIRGLISKGTSQIETTGCTLLNMKINSAKWFAVNSVNRLSITVTRDTGNVDLKSLKFIYMMSDGSSKNALTSTSGGDASIYTGEVITANLGITVPKELETKVYTLSAIATTDKPTSVQVAGVLPNDMLCQVSSTADVTTA